LELPPLTTDLDEAKAHLETYGLARIEGALAPEDLAAAHQRVEEQARAEAGTTMGVTDGARQGQPRGPNQWVHNLINKGEIFRRLVTMDMPLTLMRHLLGKGFLLSSLNMHEAGRGGEPQPLHMDGMMAPIETPYPIVANIAWLLDDTNEANGATRMIPGSHAWPLEKLEASVRPENTVAAEGPAGSAIVFGGRLWHGTGANRNGARRRIVLGYYCRGFIRQQENYSLSLAPEVHAQCSDELLKLLGFSVYRTLGGMSATRPMFGGVVPRPTKFVTELREP
jgi:ectoine hydroxylase-related dioxygenase (phytanoyl-CoA dioxygenase family)